MNDARRGVPSGVRSDVRRDARRAVTSDDLEARVLELIDETELVELTRELIAAGGENPGDTEARTVEVLERACRARGLDVSVAEVTLDRPNLVATVPHYCQQDLEQPAGLLFLAHSDVVPAGPGWSVDPFAATVRDGRIYGRGASDMKGGLAAIVVALGAIRRAFAQTRGDGSGPAYPLTLACTVDEEDLDLGIRAMVGPASEPGFVSVPGDYAGCVVAEPTDLDVVVGARGDAYLEVEVTGIPAHSGRPSDGRNAIDAASRVIELIRADHVRLASVADPLLGPATWNVGRIEGGRGTSIVAPSCHLWLDRRLLPEDEPEEIADWLRRAIREAEIDRDGIRVEVEVTMVMPGFRTDSREAVVPAALAACIDGRASTAAPAGSTAGDSAGDSPGDSGSRDPSITGWTAACDGGFIARDLRIPTIVFGPGSINDQAHQVDESVAIDELVRAARAYALMALRVPSWASTHGAAACGASAEAHGEETEECGSSVGADLRDE